jgi:hypothetical protein
MQRHSQGFRMFARKRTAIMCGMGAVFAASISSFTESGRVDHRSDYSVSCFLPADEQPSKLWIPAVSPGRNLYICRSRADSGRFYA